MDLVVGIFLFALIFVPLALVVWGCVRAVQRRNVWIQASASLPWPRSEAATHLVATVTPRLQRLNYRLSSQGINAIAFEKTYRPVWLAIPCVFLFPLGLLSLIYKKRIDLTFAIQQGSEGSEVQFTGYGPLGLSDELRIDLEKRSEFVG